MMFYFNKNLINTFKVDSSKMRTHWPVEPITDLAILDHA